MHVRVSTVDVILVFSCRRPVFCALEKTEGKGTFCACDRFKNISATSLLETTAPHLILHLQLQIQEIWEQQKKEQEFSLCLFFMFTALTHVVIYPQKKKTTLLGKLKRT